jgi:DNA-binding NarL/FixJ family response regulator
MYAAEAPRERTPVRVLLVDDDPLFAEVLTVLLSPYEEIEIIGYAGDGATGVKLASSLAPDVVLMDLNMPVMDGIEATRHVRTSLPSVHVLIVTGSALPADVDRARSAGAAGYVPKDRIGDLARIVLATTTAGPLDSLARAIQPAAHAAELT